MAIAQSGEQPEYQAVLCLAPQQKRPNSLKELAGVRKEFHLMGHSHTAETVIFDRRRGKHDFVQFVSIPSRSAGYNRAMIRLNISEVKITSLDLFEGKEPK